MWTHRNTLPGLALVLRLSACVPIALLVNVARILTLAGYRYLVYPDWETPELHYLIGFLWILPFVPLLLPRKESGTLGFDTAYTIVVLAVLAPALAEPGGWLLLLCSALVLAVHEVQPVTRARLAGIGVWLLAGIYIFASATESLWLPWLLLCPLLVPARLWRHPAFIALLPGTVSIIALHETTAYIAAVPAVVFAYMVLIREGVATRPPYQRLTAVTVLARSLVVAGLAMAMVLPSIARPVIDVQPPPARLMAQQVAENGFRINTVGQSPVLSAFWFGPFSDGRHHSLRSCLKFRGISLEPSDEADHVFESGDKYLAEFFIHRGRLHDSYRSYLLHSVVPFSDPGVHLVFEAPRSEMTAGQFHAWAATAAERAVITLR